MISEVIFANCITLKISCLVKPNFRNRFLWITFYPFCSQCLCVICLNMVSQQVFFRLSAGLPTARILNKGWPIHLLTASGLANRLQMLSGKNCRRGKLQTAGQVWQCCSPSEIILLLLSICPPFLSFILFLNLECSKITL